MRVVALAVGLVLLSLVVESLEFGLVTIAHGAVTVEPATYFGVRNQAWFLAAKLAYNTAGAVLAGYVTARLARRAPYTDAVASSSERT